MNRRVWLSEQRLDGRPIADAAGVAGEDFETEVYSPYGMVVDKAGESVLIEIHGDGHNHIALPPQGDRVAPKETLLIYYGETEIEVGKRQIVIRVNGGKMTIDGKTISTDMDIKTTGDVVAGAISLKKHKHSGVTSGGGVSGVAVP